MVRRESDRSIAYFTMEIGLRNDIPTFSGGLGVLAGDTIKSASDLGLPVVVVTLMCRQGYFRQEIDAAGRQHEHPVAWDPAANMKLQGPLVRVQIEGRLVQIQAWRFDVLSLGVPGSVVPVYFLDTDVEGNDPRDRSITGALYGGDDRHRLKQEVVLGVGGVRMLEALGYSSLRKYHMNEGHAGLLTIELLRRTRRNIEEVWDERSVYNREEVRQLCVFTTHTPVEAGHDRFPWEMVGEVLEELVPLRVLKELGGADGLNMTLLGLNLSNYINGVAKKHGEVSQGMFPGYAIHAITNGVHSFTWTCEEFKALYNHYLPGWANEPELFVRAGVIPDEQLWDAHQLAKRRLLGIVEQRTGRHFSPDVLTFGFARRATAYKRADLLFSDLERLRRIAGGRLQVIYGGKAHPKDEPGKRLIADIHRFARELGEEIPVVYLENYDMDLALHLVSGVDVWLNTPLRPREASGTSGMKAAHNGVLNFSVLDGWWIEGHIENFTGWSIGPEPTESSCLVENDGCQDAGSLYEKLERCVIPVYYGERDTWIRMMQNAIGKNAYFFNTHRMMRRYVTDAYIR
ncbi:MAG: alpha-glucan family phosphorylase [Candidatus Methylomirabilia bacterium]